MTAPPVPVWPRPVARGPLVALLAAALSLALAGGPGDVLSTSIEIPAVARAVSSEPVESPGSEAQRVVEEVSHRFVAGASGELFVDDGAYRAELGADGFALAVGGQRLTWSVPDVRRGSALINRAVGPWNAEGNVASRAVAEDVSERLTARGGEVQWDVVFAARPPGSGPLHVEARLGGAIDDVQRGPDGLTVTMGGTSLHIGELVVLDVTGEELHRAVPVISGGRLALIVPASVVDDAEYPLTLDPTIGAAHHVSPVPLTGLEHDAADVASDGTNRLVVWRSWDAASTAQAIQAARVDANGNVLDPNGLFLAIFSRYGRPAVTFMNGNYLVVWSSGHQDGNPGDIRGVRVSPSGAVLDSIGGFVINGGPVKASRVAVAFDGTNALVLWEDLRNGGVTDIYGTRVSPAGTVLDGSGFAVSGVPQPQALPAVSYNGTNYMVTWSDARSSAVADDFDVYAARVSPAATVLDPNGIVVSTRPFSAVGDIAWSGTNHLVTWTDDSRSGDAIRAARLAASGNVLDPGGFVVSGVDGSSAPSVAYNGSSYQVVWNRSGADSDIFGARVATDGAVLDPTPVLVGSSGEDDLLPAVAAAGRNLFVAWHDRVTPSSAVGGQILGARMSSNGSLVDPAPRLVSTQVVDQFVGGAASDGTNQLVVWSDYRNNATTGSDIYAARVGSSGGPLETQGIRVSSLVAADGQPAVAFGAGMYLVVWKTDPSGANNADVYAERVSTNGALFGSAFKVGFEGIAVDQSEPAVAFDGTNFVVVWTDGFSTAGDGRPDIRGIRVSPTTGNTGIVFSVSVAAGLQSAPSVAFDGTNSLVVWSDGRNGNNDIYGARVSTSGSVLDTAGIAIQTTSANQFRPSIAFGGGQYLVAWDENGDVRGRRVTPAGSVLDPDGIPISTAPDGQTSPAVAFNRSFLVVWEDRRSGASYDIYAARVGTDGAVQDPSGIPSSTSASDEIAPVVTSRPGGWRLAYQVDLGEGSAVYQRAAK